jgi:hypothetical protein
VTALAGSGVTGDIPAGKPLGYPVEARDALKQWAFKKDWLTSQNKQLFIKL